MINNVQINKRSLVVFILDMCWIVAAAAFRNNVIEIIVSQSARLTPHPPPPPPGHHTLNKYKPNLRLLA